MAQDTCRMTGCDKETRNKGDLQYPDDPEKTASNGKRFRVGVFGANFCSDYHEIKYEKLKDEARDARRDERRDTIPDRDLPERDGPPY